MQKMNANTQRHTEAHTQTRTQKQTPLHSRQKKKNNPLAISYLWSSTPHTVFAPLRLSTYALTVLKLFLDFCPDFTEETGMLPTLNEATVTKYWGNEGTSQVKSIS